MVGLTSHYEVEASKDGDDWNSVGGLLRNLYDAIFKRDQLQDAFEHINFRAVRVTREEVDVERVEET